MIRLLFQFLLTGHHFFFDLPEQTVRQTRIIALPETAIGFVPQFSSTNTSDIRHQFVGIPEDQFKDQQLFQYYEVTFKGSVRFNLFLDQVALKPNLSIKLCRFKRKRK